MEWNTVHDNTQEPNRHFIFQSVGAPRFAFYFYMIFVSGWFLKQKVGSKGQLKWIFIVHYIGRMKKITFLWVKICSGRDYWRGLVNYIEVQSIIGILKSFAVVLSLSCWRGIYEKLMKSELGFEPQKFSLSKLSWGRKVSNSNFF